MIIRLQLLQGTFQLGCAAFSGINPFEGCDGRQMASYGSFGPYQTLRSVDIPKQTCVLSAVEHSFTNDASLIPTSHATGMFWASYRCAVSDPSLGKLLDASICACSLLSNLGSLRFSLRNHQIKTPTFVGAFIW